MKRIVIAVTVPLEGSTDLELKSQLVVEVSYQDIIELAQKKAIKFYRNDMKLSIKSKPTAKLNVYEE